MVQTEPVRPEDEPILFEIYASTRLTEIAAWGWPAAQQDAFLRMQFLAQARAYAMQYPDADHRLIRVAGQPAGRILVHRGPDAFTLVDIALLPDYRGGGMGTELIRDLKAEAAVAGRVVRLHVLKGNPAIRLYQRLDFAVTADTGMYYAMQWGRTGD